MMAIGILGIIFQYQTLWLAIIGGILRMIAETAYRTVQQSEQPVSYTHLRAHETVLDIVCRLLLEKKKT